MAYSERHHWHRPIAGLILERTLLVPATSFPFLIRLARINSIFTASTRSPKADWWKWPRCGHSDAQRSVGASESLAPAFSRQYLTCPFCGQTESQRDPVYPIARAISFPQAGMNLITSAD